MDVDFKMNKNMNTPAKPVIITKINEKNKWLYK